VGSSFPTKMSLSSGPFQHSRNQEATLWVGNLEPQCTQEILWELFNQCGPVADVNMPVDKITQAHQGFAFVEYENADDADYSIRILNMCKLYGKPMRVNKAAKDSQKDQEFFANLFVGNLDPEVDEKVLYDTFSAFGAVLAAKVMTDDDGRSRGFAFVNFDNFESSDNAVEAMNNQFLGGKPVSVSYAYKKDGSKGERHGNSAERLLASQKSSSLNKLTPSMFSTPMPMSMQTPSMGRGGFGPPVGMGGMQAGMGRGLAGSQPPPINPQMIAQQQMQMQQIQQQQIAAAAQQQQQYAAVQAAQHAHMAQHMAMQQQQIAQSGRSMPPPPPPGFGRGLPMAGRGFGGPPFFQQPMFQTPPPMPASGPPAAVSSPAAPTP